MISKIIESVMLILAPVDGCDRTWSAQPCFHRKNVFHFESPAVARVGRWCVCRRGLAVVVDLLELYCLVSFTWLWSLGKYQVKVGGRIPSHKVLFRFVVPTFHTEGHTFQGCSKPWCQSAIGRFIRTVPDSSGPHSTLFNIHQLFT